LREQEKKAIHEIDEAINEIKKASIDDGKDLTIIPQLTPASIGADVSTVHSNSSTKPTTTSPSRKTMARPRASSSAHRQGPQTHRRSHSPRRVILPNRFASPDVAAIFSRGVHLYCSE
jgi:hypothetical protein